MLQSVTVCDEQELIEIQGSIGQFLIDGGASHHQAHGYDIIMCPPPPNFVLPCRIITCMHEQRIPALYTLSDWEQG